MKIIKLLPGIVLPRCWWRWAWESCKKATRQLSKATVQNKTVAFVFGLRNGVTYLLELRS